MDYVQDKSGRHLLRINQMMTVPDYVKSASVIDEDIQPLSDNQFADVAHRQFPIDSKGHAFLSYAYYKSASVDNPAVLARIKGAAERLGIAGDLKLVDDAFTALEKAANTPQFAIMVDFQEPDPNSDVPLKKQGGVHGFYPINSPEQIEHSGVKLGNDRSKIPIELFVEGSRNLVKAANAQNVPLGRIPKCVLDYGVERVPNFDYLKHAAEQRVKLTGDTTYEEIYKVASTNDENRSWDDYAELWRKADVVNSVEYNRNVMDPYFIFNSGVTKAAYEQELESWTLVHNTPVPRVALANLPEKTIHQNFPKEAAAQILPIIKKAASTLGSELTLEIEKLGRGVQAQLLKFVSQAPV